MVENCPTNCPTEKLWAAPFLATTGFAKSLSWVWGFASRHSTGDPEYPDSIWQPRVEMFINWSAGQLPSGKHTKSYGKSPFSKGKSTINGIFSIAMLNYINYVIRKLNALLQVAPIFCREDGYHQNVRVWMLDSKPRSKNLMQSGSPAKNTFQIMGGWSAGNISTPSLGNCSPAHLHPHTSVRITHVHPLATGTSPCL